MLQHAQLNLNGLYEHLMNFYYEIHLAEENQGRDLVDRFTRVSTRMAAEFLRSIPPTSPREGISPLRSLLLSTGFFAQDAAPTLRRFSRRIHRKVRGQWAIEDLGIRQAHSIAKGRGVRLAIIDTGLDPSLREIRSQVKAYKDLLDGAKPSQNQGRFPYDWEGHGTSLASVIQQVAPDCELLVIKFFESESMAGVPASRWTHYLIAAGMLWAARQGADIINLSVSLRHDTPTLRRAVQYCWDRNILIVTSMGNTREPDSSGTKTYPAGYAQTLAVGGVEKQGDEFKVWENSAAGPFVDIVAPAKDIWVEAPQYRGRPFSGNLRYGNSLASSFTAAAAALVLSAMPPGSLDILRSRPGQLPGTLRQIFLETASNTRLGFNAPNPLSGHGLIDILGALEKARVITGAPGWSPN